MEGRESAKGYGTIGEEGPLNSQPNIQPLCPEMRWDGTTGIFTGTTGF